jgi:hypothetical protein
MSASRFHLVDLLAAAFCVACVLGCFPNVVQIERESARRAQCVNNLKQIGLGIQNFHDIRKEIVPSYLSADNEPKGTADAGGFATWAVLLMPFMEQAALFDQFDVKTPLTTDSAPGRPANSHKLGRETVVAQFICPTRRSSPGLTTDGAGAIGDFGSVTYGEAPASAPARPPVNRAQPRTFDGAMMVSRVFNAQATRQTIQGISLEPGEYRTLTNFASVIDGLSNTAFIGEKAVHQDRLGVAKIDGDHQDGTVYFGKGATVDSYSAPGPMAYWSRRMAPENAEDKVLPATPAEESPKNRFGGWHPGITLFVLGDGAVRPVRHTNSNLVLQRFGTRNDRNVFDLE